MPYAEQAPRYKLRPKLHALHCQVVCRAASGAAFNPKFASCWNEESFIGELCSVVKGASHASTLSKRVVQRWLLQYNAQLCMCRKKCWRELSLSLSLCVEATGLQGLKPARFPNWCSSPVNLPICIYIYRYTQTCVYIDTYIYIYI